MNKEPYYTLDLQGEGIVMAEPDVAVISLGAETTDQNLKIAQEENAKRMQEIIRALRRMGIDEGDIQTENYTINKKYDYVNGEQIDKGYVVRNTLKITVQDIDRAGEVIDTAVEQGANVVNGVSFEIEDQSYYYQQALNLALVDAQEKALSLAKQMSVQVMSVPLRLVEESDRQVPYGATYYAKAGDAQTPIEPGRKQITAKIRALFSYSAI